VVLLDQDEVVEPSAVVDAAAVGDGALLERA
jgi:hypothetical protein